MNTITRFNRSQIALFRYLRTSPHLDARLLSIDLNRIIKPEDIIKIEFYKDLIGWQLIDNSIVLMPQSQLFQYLEDLAEL